MSSMFKNFIPYAVLPTLAQQFREEWVASVEFGENQAEEALEKHLSVDPTGAQWRTIGFVKAFGDRVVYQVAPYVYTILVRINERILPAKVRDEHVRARVAVIERQDGRKVSKKEYAQIRDEVEMALLPKAFIRRTEVPVLVTNEFLFVSTSSAKRADDVMALLRDAIPGFRENAKPRLIDTRQEATALFEAVLRQPNVDALTAANAGVFKADGKRTVRVKDVDLHGEEVEATLGAGYRPSELRMGLSEDDTDQSLATPVVAFTMTERMVFKNVKFEGQIFEEATADAEADEAAQFDAIAYLVARWYERIVRTVSDALGGYTKPSETSSEAEPEDDDL